MQISTIGIDLAKSVFQVHGVDAAGKVIITKKLRRSQVLPLFEKIAALPDRHGSVRHIASLGTRAQGAWARRASNAGELCESICQAQQE